MKFHWLVFFLSVFLFTSCEVQKRQYRNGYYINWSSNQAHVHVNDTVELEGPSDVEKIAMRSEVIPGADAVTVDDSINTSTSASDLNETRPKSTYHPYDYNDDPKPEGHDKLNPVITPIVGGAFVLPLILLALELLSAFPANPYVLLIGLPLVAALLFALSMNLRKKYTVLKSLGDKRERLRTSAHFHRFQILLYIYFAAALMLSLGFALGLTTSGILGWVGVIFTGGGVAVGLGVAAVLLVLFALYWILWRKDPTGIKPPRNPHPPKDH